MSTIRETRRAALATAGVFAVAGALASPASAASASVELECKYPLIGIQPVTATVSYDDAVAARPGKAFSLNATTQLTLGGDASVALEIIDARTVSADIKTSLQIGSKSTQFSGNTGTQTPPLSPDPVLVSASGVTDPVKLGAGSATVSLTGLTFSVRPVNSAGVPIQVRPLSGVPDSDGDPYTFDVICSIASGQSTTIGTVDVSPHN